MIIIQYLMSEHSSDSISNRLAQPEKNTAHKKYLTRLIDHNHINQLCDKESSPTDLPESWSHKELLHNIYQLINHGNQIIPVTHKEVYLLSRPLKAMAQWRIHYMPKEVYILSRPSKLQPITDYTIITQCTHREQLPSTLEAQHAHREPATAISQALITSSKLRVDQCKMVIIQPRVYRRTRTMLKIRCTDVRETRYNYSQSTESKKAKFQTPSTSNEARNYVENITGSCPPDKIRYCFCFSIFRIRRKGGNCSRCSCTCRHSCTCTHTGDS